MKNIIINTTLFLIILIFSSCEKDPCEMSCLGCVELEEYFYLTYDCPAVYMENDEIKFEITLMDIEDNRSLDTECEVSTGGTFKAKYIVKYNNEEKHGEYNQPGCLGKSIPNPEFYQIKSIDIEDYKIYALKVYPRSILIDEYPELDEYELVMKIVKI